MEKEKSINLRNIPIWFLSGIIIFPVLIVFGIIFFALTFGNFNILFWLIIPSVAFEGLFETCCYTFSNNPIANLLFALIFWFIIGATIGLIIKILKYKEVQARHSSQ